VFDPAAHGWEPLLDGGFGEFAGPFWQRAAGAGIDYGFLADARHKNHRGIVHGGVLMTFADNSMGMTAWRANGEKPQVTAQLGVQFVAATYLGEFVEARCTVVSKTRSLVFVTALLAVGDRVVLSASGVWKILG
jgi:uncharacterized protein (TIGR00369 family)